jgi:hypothetical protein
VVPHLSHTRSAHVVHTECQSQALWWALP